MAIHEDCRMFDMKRPENSGNWLWPILGQEHWAYQ